MSYIHLFSDIQDGPTADINHFTDGRTSFLYAMARQPTRRLNMSTEDDLPFTIG